MTASFVSPGWVNFNVNFIEYRFLPIPPYEGPYEGYRSANSAHLTGGLWYYTVCVRDFIPNSDGFYDIFPKTGTRCHTGLNSMTLKSGYTMVSTYIFFLKLLRA